MVERRWVTVQYVVELTGFSKPAIYKMAREGRIPAQRIGRVVRFDPVQLEQWMARQPKANT